MALVAAKTLVKCSGAAVAMTSEATTLSGGNTIAQITDTAKRVIDPATAISVFDNGSPVADADYTVDLLFGKVTKASGSFTGPVTITAAYLPTFAWAEATGFEINFSATVLEITAMAAATANRSRSRGLRDVSGSISGLDVLTTDLDTGGGTVVPFTDWGAGTRRVVEVTMSDGTIFRAFAKFADLKQGGELDDLFKSTLNWQADATTASDQTEASTFGWSSGG